MYDNHILCKEYKGLKDTVVNILNGDDDTTDVNELAEHIQELYENGEIQSTQYDDLMRYIEDLM